MFLDASAIIAILKREPDRADLLQKLAASPTPLLFSVMSRFEAAVGLARAEAGQHSASTPEAIKMATATVDRFLTGLGAECTDLTPAIGDLALIAAQTYGRCVGHPARLNLGDCFAYASAKAAGVGLLYKGGDFALTDLG